MCDHILAKQLCGNGPTTGGEYWWCLQCGALGSRPDAAFGDPKWDLPETEKFGRAIGREKYIQKIEPGVWPKWR